VINENLHNALMDLVEGIRSVTLGSIEHSVISGSGRELIHNWNDHNPGDLINEVDELAHWEQLCLEELQRN